MINKQIQRLKTIKSEFDIDGQWLSYLYPLFSVIAALAIGAILIAMAGKSPITAYRAMIHSAFGNRNNLGETLVKTIPLLLAGLGTAFSFRAKIFNIGAEGQIFMGALGAGFVGLFLGELRPIIGIPLILIAGFLTGGIWGGLAGFLKERFHANEIIITLMMNYIAIEITSYLVGGPWRDPKSTEAFTAHFSEGTILPIVLPGTRLHAGILVAILSVIVITWILRKTVFGYQITLTGANDEAARFSGMNIGKLVILTMFISGGLAGLAGVSEVAGIHHRVLENFSSGYGYTAIAIAMLGGSNPIGVAIASFLFAALAIGVNGMQDLVGVPVSLVYIIEGLVLLFVLGSELFRKRGYIFRRNS